MSPAVDKTVYTCEDTIAALSSRAGSHVRAVLRVSGPKAMEICQAVFDPGDNYNGLSQGSRWLSGWFKLDQQLRCPGIVYLFAGPHSYTGQDLIEYHLPGGAVVEEMALAALIAAGARLAEPGEFTLRAFLSGRIDLTQAEAVVAIISSQTDAQLQAANSLAEGKLSATIQSIQNKLAALIGELEANIDFLEEDIKFIGTSQAAAIIEQLQTELEELLANASRLEQLDREPRVVLAGWANAGKSMLLNSLSGLSRAIVSMVAGTTRDLLMAPMRMTEDRYPQGEVLLVDAAGLGNWPADEIDMAARQASFQAVRQADLVLYVVDASEKILADQWESLESLPRGRTVIVVNKIDLLSRAQVQSLLQAIRQERTERVIGISAKFGQGLDELRVVISEKLADIEMPAWQGRLVMTGRAEEGLKQAVQALNRARNLLGETAEIMNPELLAVELYEVNAFLGAITGQVSAQEVLEDIFSRFCIGK